MKKYLITILFLFGSIIFAKDAEYIGSNKCGKCHKKENKGAQLKAWEKGPHSKTFEILKSDESAAIAKEKGLKTPAYEAPECLSCHTTGYAHGGYEVQSEEFYNQVTEKGKPTKAVKRMIGLQGVGCESCHGAGSEYKKVHKKDYEKSLTLGLILPTEEVCITCHNDKSPTFKGFDFDKQYKEISHPFPEGMERKNRK
jgi:hypothetical protein